MWTNILFNSKIILNRPTGLLNFNFNENFADPQSLINTGVGDNFRIRPSYRLSQDIFNISKVN